jgi:AhpD family alkylhydroperoxidase
MSAEPYIHQLKPVDRDRAVGASMALLDTTLRQVGFVPNMYANMADAPAVLSTCLHGHALFRSESGLSTVEQAVVFLAVSQGNGCTCCTAMHSMIADRVSGVPTPVWQAIRQQQPIPDAKLAVLFATTTDLVKTLGQPCPASVKAFLAAGYQERDLIYIILAASAQVLNNYSNHAFAPVLDERFSACKVS